MKLLLHSLSAMLLGVLSPQAGAVVGGEPYSSEQYQRSAHVGIQVVSGGLMDVCGGTLLNPTTILTSATCFLRVDTADTNITVFRSADMNRDRANQIRIHVWQVIRHPDYSRTDDSTPDFAIVKLTRPFPGSEQIHYPLLRELTEAEHYGVYGYGRDDSGQMGVLRKIFKTKADIRDYHDKRLLGFDQSKGGICAGDTGSPLWVSFSDRLYVIAINKSVIGGAGGLCRGSGYFMKVAPVMAWLTAYSGAAQGGQASAAPGAAAADDPKVVGGAFKP